MTTLRLRIDTLCQLLEMQCENAQSYFFIALEISKAKS